jgi:beta-galactosidase
MIGRREFLTGSAAALMYGAGRNGLAEALAPSPARPVTYDDRSVMIDGRRVLLTCGEIHYPRSTRAMWPMLLQRSKQLGLNTITTYVFWNVHETSRGVYDFSGERDLGHFLDLCQEHRLAVFLRAGPYICAEWNFGGFPPYLRDEPGITIRTMNKAYTARVEAWFERLAKLVKPRLSSNGGPVVLVQVENEYTNVAKRYGEEGQEYLRWIVELADRVGFSGVPSTMCEGGAQGAIETSNGFSISPERIATVRKTHPGTPLLWTEIYPAWYRVWGGGAILSGDGKFMAGGILDFISRGGSGINYYPWHGGTNFGRNSMYLQTTSYDFSAPLDEYGSVTATGVYLGQLHAVLQDNSELLLEGERTENTEDAKRTVTWRKGNEEIQLVQEIHAPQGQSQRFPPRQAKSARLITARGEVLFDVDATRESVARRFALNEWKPVTQTDGRPLSWLAWDEPLPVDRRDKGIACVEPLEQLSLTKDNTDYCWYSTRLQVAVAGAQEIVIPYGGDFFYLYVDGKLAATSKLPLSEDRGPITPDDPANPRILSNNSENGHPHGFQHTFTLPQMATGTHQIDLLATALGMIKGDWQIASPMNFERKGIWNGVQCNGKPMQDWTVRPGLVGERRKLATRPTNVSWRAVAEPRTLRWYRFRFAAPRNLLGNSAVFRLDAAGLGKGMIWVNGRSAGRHWLIQARSPADTLSQRYYHVPADWLQAANEIVILEEQEASPVSVQLQVRV